MEFLNWIVQHPTWCCTSSWSVAFRNTSDVGERKPSCYSQRDVPLGKAYKTLAKKFWSDLLQDQAMKAWMDRTVMRAGEHHHELFHDLFRKVSYWFGAHRYTGSDQAVMALCRRVECLRGASATWKKSLAPRQWSMGEYFCNSGNVFLKYLRYQ